MKDEPTLKDLIQSDLRKVRQNINLKNFISAFLLNQSFKRICIYRLAHEYRNTLIYEYLWGGGVERLISTH